MVLEKIRRHFEDGGEFGARPRVGESQQDVEAASVADEGMRDIRRMYGSDAAWADVRMRLDLILRRSA